FSAPTNRLQGAEQGAASQGCTRRTLRAGRGRQRLGPPRASARRQGCAISGSDRRGNPLVPLSREARKDSPDVSGSFPCARCLRILAWRISLYRDLILARGRTERRASTPFDRVE